MSRINLANLAFLAALTAVITIGFLASPVAADSIERLIQDATSASGAKRLQAVQALGDSGDLRALQPLLGLLDDTEPTIRDHALKALQTLAQSLRQLYAHLTHWIDTLLLQFDIFLAPEPPVERTQSRRVI